MIAFECKNNPSARREKRRRGTQNKNPFYKIVDRQRLTTSINVKQIHQSKMILVSKTMVRTKFCEFEMNYCFCGIAYMETSVIS